MKKYNFYLGGIFFLTIVLSSYAIYNIPYIVKNMPKSEEKKLYELKIMVEQAKLRKELKKLEKKD